MKTMQADTNFNTNPILTLPIESILTDSQVLNANHIGTTIHVEAPFFVELEEDRFIKLLLDLKVVDRTGRVCEEYANFFQLPALEKKEVDAIKELLSTEIQISGRKPYPPLNIKITPKQILERGKQVDSNKMKECVKFCGSRFRHILGTSYFLKVLRHFFHETLRKPDINIENILTPFLKNRLKQRGNDADFHFLFQEASMEKCIQAAEGILDQLESALSKNNLSAKKVSDYLKKLKARIFPLEGHKYLKEVLKNDVFFQASHPKLFQTFIKVQAFIQAADVFEKGFSVRSLGDRKENNFDFVYFSSNLHRQGSSTTDCLWVFIDHLLGPETEKSIFPCSTDNDGLQYFIDNNAGLYRRKKGELEIRDFPKILSAELEGMRSLENFPEQFFELFERSNKKGEAFAVEIMDLLKHATKSFYTYNFDPEKLIGLSFRACQYLLLKGEKYSYEISHLWKLIVEHLDNLPKFGETKNIHPFFKMLLEAVQSPFLEFKHIDACLQIASYVGLNSPSCLNPQYKVFISQNAKGPLMQLRVMCDPNLFFSFQFEPHNALETIYHIPDVQAVKILVNLYREICSKLYVDKKNSSPLSKYDDHPILKAVEIGEQAKKLLESFNPSLTELGYEVFFALQKQKFNSDYLPTLLKPLILSSDISFIPIKKKILSNIHRLWQEDTNFENLFGQILMRSSKPLENESLIDQQLDWLLQLAKTNKRDMEKAAIDLYFELESSLPSTKQTKFLFEFLKVISNFPLMLILSRKASKNPFLDPFVRLRILAGTANESLRKDPSHIYIDILFSEICNVLKSTELKVEQGSEHYLPSISVIFHKLIDVAILKTNYEKAYELLSLGLKNRLIIKNNQTGQQWLMITQYFLETSFNELIKAYDSWKLAQNYELWECLDIQIQKNCLSRLCIALSGEQGNQKTAQQITEEIIQNTKNDSLLYPLFLTQFEQSFFIELKKEDKLSDQKILYFLSAFTQLIQKERDFSSYWKEEKNLIDNLLKILFEKYSQDFFNSNLNRLKSFFYGINACYPYPYLSEILMTVLTNWHNSLQNKASPQFLFLLCEFFLQNLIAVSSNKNYTQKIMILFFSLFKETFCRQFISEALPLSLKALLQSPNMKDLIINLATKEMSKTINQILFIFSVRNIKPFLSAPFFQSALWAIEKALEKNDSSQFEMIEKIVIFNTSFIINSKDKVNKEKLIQICRKMFEFTIKSEAYLKAYFWFEKERELDNHSKSIFPNALLIKILCALVVNKDYITALKVCELILPLKEGEIRELEKDWGLILNALSTNGHPVQSAKIILKNIKLDPISKIFESSIKSIIQSLISQYQKKSEAYCQDEGSFEELGLAFSLIKRLCLSSGKLWIDMLSAIEYAKDDNLMSQVISFLFDQSFKQSSNLKLSVIDLGKCWNIAIKAIKDIGHPYLIKILEEKHSILDLYKHKELAIFKQSTFRSLCEGITSYFQTNHEWKRYIFSLEFFVMLLRREILENRSMDFDEVFLDKFKLVLKLREQKSFIEYGFKYLQDVMQLDLEKITYKVKKIDKEKPYFFKKDKRDIPNMEDFHTPFLDLFSFEFSNILIFVKNKVFLKKFNKRNENEDSLPSENIFQEKKNNVAFKISQNQKEILEEQSIEFIRLILKRKVSCNPGHIMNFLLCFDTKYYDEIGICMEKIFEQPPRKDAGNPNFSGFKKLLASLLYQFLISEINTLQNIANRCLKMPNAKFWLPLRAPEYLKEISLHGKIEPFFFKEEMLELAKILDESKRCGTNRNKAIYEKHLQLKIKFEKKIEPYMRVVTIVAKVAFGFLSAYIVSYVTSSETS